MPSDLNLGQAAAAILRAAALLFERAKFGSPEWTAAADLPAALFRFQAELQLREEELGRRAVAAGPAEQQAERPAAGRVIRKPAVMAPTTGSET